MKGKKPKKRDIWKEIEDHMKDPTYVKAVDEFIRLTT